MKQMTAVTTIAVLGVVFLTSAGHAAWQGDFIYCAQDRYNSDGSSTWQYGIAVAFLDYANNFYGGETHSGYDRSEPLCQNDGLTGNDALSITRGVVAYDADTALILCGNRWGSSSTKVFLNQIEYRAGEAMESQGLTNPGRVSTYNPAVQPITDGGLTSGRLQMAVDPVGLPGGGYDPNADDGGIDPRVRLDGTLGVDGLVGADNLGGLAVDDVGDLYVCGRVKGTGDARVYKIPGAGGPLGNAAGQRAVDLLGAPSLLVQKVTPVSWFTGVAAGCGAVFTADYPVQSLDVYDANSGALRLSVDLAAPSGVLDGLPPMTPEDVRILPLLNAGGLASGACAGDECMVRVIVDVLDSNYVEGGGNTQDVIHLLVLDIDLGANAVVGAKALKMQGGLEHGHSVAGAQSPFSAIDWLEVSPDGDLAVSDSRGSNDSRVHSITTEDLATALATPGLIVPVNVVSNNFWADRCFDFAKGGAFIPEPMSVALLLPGVLALIRRWR